jgi:DNA-binding GntR family transcriptional regulator
LERAADLVYSQVRDEIVRGQLPGGAHLREEEIADRFGVSRTPAREALRRLAAQGLVEVSPNRGARVVEWDKLDVEAVYELRAVVEGFSAFRAASRIPDAQVADLADVCDAIDAIDPPSLSGNQAETQRLFELNSRFHATIAEVAGGSRLNMMRESVVVLPLMLRMIVGFSEEDHRRNNDYHREIIEAFRERDPVWAEAIMHAHVLASKRVLMRNGTLAPVVSEADDPD